MGSKIILVAGATASGKSSLGLRLAEIYSGTIINADSMQVYGDLQILSARPSKDEMANIPHKLYGFLKPSQSYSAAQWHDDAMAEVKTALEQGITPILLGGTGLYFKSLLEGLTQIPEIKADIREEIREMLDKKGAEYIHLCLKDEDPHMAEKLDKNDGQRLARALEVIRSTGVSLLEWQNKPHSGGLSDYDKQGEILKLVVERDRIDTYKRINDRFAQMIEEGALDEVKKTMSMNLPSDNLAMKALGVSSLVKYVNGEIELDEAVEEAKTLTRRYAKRQMTWMRNQFPSWKRINPDDVKNKTDDEIKRLLET